MRWRRRRVPRLRDEPLDEDAAALMSELVGMPVPAGSTVAGLTAEIAPGIVGGFTERMDSLKRRGLWSGELQRRFDAVESLPDEAQPEELREVVDALLSEVTRVEHENPPSPH